LQTSGTLRPGGARSGGLLVRRSAHG